VIVNHEDLYNFEHGDFWLIMQEEYPTTSNSSLEIEINEQMNFVPLASYAMCPIFEHIEQGLVEWNKTEEEQP
jgi:hypothetical protein